MICQPGEPPQAQRADRTKAQATGLGLPEEPSRDLKGRPEIRRRGLSPVAVTRWSIRSVVRIFVADVRHNTAHSTVGRFRVQWVGVQWIGSTRYVHEGPIPTPVEYEAQFFIGETETSLVA